MDVERETLLRFFGFDGRDLEEWVCGWLEGFGYTPVQKPGWYILAEGQVPVCVVAHLDTVHRVGKRSVYFDEKEGVLWSPQGVGGDDRAGVLAVWELLRRGVRPWVLFTWGEESGGVGAERACVDVGNVLARLNWFVEFDRKGKGEAVFYDCANKEFEGVVLGHGFRKGIGTFTDISVICPEVGVAGVNVSAGYYAPHTANEYVVLEDVLFSVERVERMIREAGERSFAYVDGGSWRKPWRRWRSPLITGWEDEDLFRIEGTYRKLKVKGEEVYVLEKGAKVRFSFVEQVLIGIGDGSEELAILPF